MPHLPVFSTIGQGMALFGLNIGKLMKWGIIPSLLSLAALGAALGLGLLLQPEEQGGVPWWWAGFIPAVFFSILAWVPYGMRINQLAVTGRVEPGGHVGKMFTQAALWYFAYGLLVGLIQLGGVLISAVPVILVMMNKGQAGVDPRVALAGLATAGLMLVFFIMTSPLNLIYAAASVEREPSLGRAYNLGAHCKLRLFVCVVLTGLLFGVLQQGVEWIASSIGGRFSEHAKLLFAPVLVLVWFFSYVTAAAVPAVAYRILSGLPDPRKSAGDGQPLTVPEPAPASPEPAPGRTSDDGQ